MKKTITYCPECSKSDLDPAGRNLTFEIVDSKEPGVHSIARIRDRDTGTILKGSEFLGIEPDACSQAARCGDVFVFAVEWPEGPGTADATEDPSGG